MTCRTNDIPYYDDILKHTMTYHTISHHTIPSHTIPYHIIPYHDIPYYDMPMPYHYVPYYTILHNDIRLTYDMIRYQTTPCHTISLQNEDLPFLTFGWYMDNGDFITNPSSYLSTASFNALITSCLHKNYNQLNIH